MTAREDTRVLISVVGVEEMTLRIGGVASAAKFAHLGF